MCDKCCDDCENEDPQEMHLCGDDYGWLYYCKLTGDLIQREENEKAPDWCPLNSI